MKTTIFANLFAALTNERETQTEDFEHRLDEFTTVDSILKDYNLKEMLTRVQRGKTWTLEALKQHLLNVRAKLDTKYLDSKLAHLIAVENAPQMTGLTVSIEWKKSRMWGSNPRAEALVNLANGMRERFDSGSIGGCGYDKESTAFANAANQSNSLLKELYLVKEYTANPNVKNHELFGYGSGYGILPSLEGGVGVSCFPKIFEKIGMDFKTVASGKSFDVYTVELKA